MRKQFSLALLLAVMAFPAISQNELYLRYADRQDLTVMELDGYRLNDSVTLNVVMIVAEEMSAWESFLREINLKETAIEMGRMADSVGDYHLKGSWFCQRYHPEIHLKASDNPTGFVVYDYRYRIVYVVEIDSYKQTDLFWRKQIHSFKNK